MSHTASAKGLELMEMLPPYYWEEHTMNAIQNAFGREIERLDDAADALIEGMFPHLATDQHLMLSMHEEEAGLPIAPADLTLDQRRERVMGVRRSRRMNSGGKWEAAVSAAIGTDGWTYEKQQPGPNQVTVYVPFPPGSDALDAVHDRIRPITSAWVEIIVASIDGFVVDESLVDEEPI